MRRVLLALGVCTLVLPAAASGSTLSLSGNTLVYSAAPGEVNDVSLSVSARTYDVLNRGSDILTVDSSLGDCQNSCSNPGITSVLADLGDGNDKYTGATTVPETINGGDGDDTIFASNATMHGGPGNDTLKSGVGPNVLDGGPGDDSLSAFPGDTVDCSGGGNDRMLEVAPPGLKRVNCGSGPNVSAEVRKVKLRKFLRGGLTIKLNCDKPCAIQWFMGGANRATQLRIHTGCACMARHFFSRTGEGNLVFAPPGPQAFPVRILGTATKKALGKAKSIRVKLIVLAQDSLGVQKKLTKVFGVKR